MPLSTRSLPSGTRKSWSNGLAKLNMAAPMLRPAVTPLLTGQVDWKAEYAYSAGLQAFIYGFPYIYNAQVRHKWVTQPRNPDVRPLRGGQRVLARRAASWTPPTATAAARTTTRSTRSPGWTSSEEPIILSHPDMGDRYFTFELMGVTSDNVDYVGQRTTGVEGRATSRSSGPAGTGELPDDVDQSRALAQPRGS